MSLRIVVTGLIGQYPLGGVTWDYFQYVLGLHRMGHEVYYIEDTGQWPYAPTENGLVKNADYNVGYIRDLFERFDLGDRWAYCFAWQKQWSGLTDAKRREVIETADLLINVSGTLENPEDYRGRGTMVYVDSDPTFTQVKLAKGDAYFRKLIDAHDVKFSFGEALGAGPQETPDSGVDWIPTRQPMVLSEWPVRDERREVYTTIMNWSSYKPLEFEGRTFGQKDIEFRAFFDLPKRVEPIRIEVAANAGKAAKLPRELLLHKGWSLVEPAQVCPDLDSYRDYISTSKGEWSVAKNGYVAGQSGWFSCRSTCYLAAGRPVIVQDTGFSKVLPTGVGIVAFRDLEGAIEGIRSVDADYEMHSAAARAIAEEWFAAEKVLGALIDRSISTGAPHGPGNSSSHPGGSTPSHTTNPSKTIVGSPFTSEAAPPPSKP